MEEYKKLDLKQNAIKILINSIYGAFGNKWFYFYDTDISQSITLQGQDLIKFSIRAINHYFSNMWHKDVELHKQLGIDQYKINKIDIEAAVYTDTDSVYVQFGSALRSIEGLPEMTEDERLRFCINIDKHRLNDYFKKCFNKYALVFNTDNKQEFELENLSKYGIWIKKKNYAIKVVYEPNKDEKLLKDQRDSNEYTIFKGLEIVKGSYPVWARDNLTTITNIFLERGYDMDLDTDVVPLLKSLKKEFVLKHVDEVAFTFRMGVYDKYVTSEKRLILEKGIPIYARAAAYHNHLLIKTGMGKRYSKLMESGKIRFYHTTANEHNFDIFAYSPGVYPEEIAPPLDYDNQFFVLIVEPINRILKAFGMNELKTDLTRNITVVKTTRRKNITDDDFYPYHIVNSTTLEHEPINEKYWKVFKHGEEVKPVDFTEYLDIITRHGLDTAIVPNLELQKYRKKMAKKHEIDLDELDGVLRDEVQA